MAASLPYAVNTHIMNISSSPHALSLEIKRNFKGGLLIGGILAVWKFKGSYQDIIESASRDYKKISNKSFPSLKIEFTVSPSLTGSHKSKSSYHLFTNPKTKLLFAFVRYFKNFPLFLTSFTIIFKCLIRSKVFIRSNDSMLRLSTHKYQIAVLTFILSYFCQTAFECFSWHWALFLLIRSTYSLCKYLIPHDLQPRVVDIYPLIHGILGLCLAFKCKYVHSKWWKLVEKCVGEKKSSWYHMLGNHHHGLLPPCTVVVHERKPNGQLQMSCCKSFMRDNIKRAVSVFIFFAKFYALTTLLSATRMANIKTMQKGSIRKVLSLLWRKTKHCVGSFGFFMIGVAITGRVPCFYKWCMWKASGKSANEYNTITGNNKTVLLLACVVLGKLSILCEAESRRVDVALSCVWNITQQWIRMCCNLESDDDAKYHQVLGSNAFTSFLFALSMAIAMYVYCGDPRCLKTMERNIITKYLMR
eukprot:66936_1